MWVEVGGPVWTRTMGTSRLQHQQHGAESYVVGTWILSDTRLVHVWGGNVCVSGGGCKAPKRPLWPFGETDKQIDQVWVVYSRPTSTSLPVLPYTSSLNVNFISYFCIFFGGGLFRNSSNALHADCICSSGRFIRKLWLLFSACALILYKECVCGGEGGRKCPCWLNLQLFSLYADQHSHSHYQCLVWGAYSHTHTHTLWWSL